MRIAFLFGVLLLAAAPTAHAGAFSDSLSVCMVKKSTEAERTLLVRWIFAGLGHHPGVRDMVKVSPQEEERLNKGVADLFMGLLTERCATETRDAVKFEGAVALQTGFETLGKVAAQGLMSDPNVSKFTDGLEKYLDKGKLEALGKDAAK